MWFNFTLLDPPLALIVSANVNNDANPDPLHIHIFFFVTVIDPCADVVCQNGGSCVDGTCICPEDYTGPNCETCKLSLYFMLFLQRSIWIFSLLSFKMTCYFLHLRTIDNIDFTHICNNFEKNQIIVVSNELYFWHAQQISLYGANKKLFLFYHVWAFTVCYIKYVTQWISIKCMCYCWNLLILNCHFLTWNVNNEANLDPLHIHLFFFVTGIDPCADVVCQNGGSCVDGTCICPEGYTGPNCETCKLGLYFMLFF